MNKLDLTLMQSVARAILPTTPLEALGLASLPRDEALELAAEMGKANDAEIDRRFLERGGDPADRFGNLAPINMPEVANEHRGDSLRYFLEAAGALFSGRGGDR